MRRTVHLMITLAAAIALLLGTAFTAWSAESMTLTFIRHGESQANFEDRIDTSVPGPDLTPLGHTQASIIAGILAANDHDGIYASNMVRTRQTAEPLAEDLGQPIVELPGLREISAGIFEGSPERSGLGRLGYAAAPAAWLLGARFVPILGSADGDGNAFDARVDDAIQLIYANGDRNPAVFSHGATIMFWTMMNVDNPDIGLLLSHQLGNTAVVVITGNPEDGWLLENWDGVEVSAEPSLPNKLFVDVRNLVTAPQTALYRIQQAFIAGDVAGLANAVRDGVLDVAAEVVGFVPKVINDVVGSATGSALPADEAPVESAEINSSAAARSHLRAVPDEDPAGEDEAEPTTISAKDEKATDEKGAPATGLTQGNKFQPGQTAADIVDDTKLADTPQDEDANAAPETPEVSTTTPESDTESDTGSDSAAAAA